MGETPLYVETYGSGPDVVLLHGWGLHGGIWQLLVPNLSQHFRVHLVDLPGFGRSPLTDDFNLEYMVQSVLAILPEKSTVVGWSMGGLVAQQLAIRYPERIQRLINVSTSPCFVNKIDWACGLKPAILQEFSQALAQDYRATLQRFLAIQTMGAEHAKEDIKLLRELLFAHGEPDPIALKEGLNVLSSVDLRHELSAIACPNLWLYGRLDALVPVASAQQIGVYVAHAQIEIMPKASHAPFISHRDAFETRILAFLRTQYDD